MWSPGVLGRDTPLLYHPVDGDRVARAGPEAAHRKADGPPVKLVLFSDLHLDARFRWAGPEAARTRRRNLEETLTSIVELAAEVGADALCCGGDLYEHDRFTPGTGELLRKVFGALHPMPVLLAPGNHDWLSPSGLYRQTTWSPNVHLFAEPAFAPFELADGLTVWGAAHCRPVGTGDFLASFSVDRGGVNLALFHGSEEGGFSWQERGKVAHASFRAADIAAAGFDHALLGHYHRPLDGERHTYPGNPDPLEFGEDGERGAVILEVGASGTVGRSRRRVARSIVQDVTVDLTGVTHAEEARDRARQQLVSCTGFVRLHLSGEVGSELDLDPEDFTAAAVAPQLDALVPRLDGVVVAYDLDALAREHTVRGQFVRDVLESAALEDDRRRRVLLTGLRALAGRDDLAVR